MAETSRVRAGPTEGTGGPPPSANKSNAKFAKNLSTSGRRFVPVFKPSGTICGLLQICLIFADYITKMFCPQRDGKKCKDVSPYDFLVYSKTTHIENKLNLIAQVFF